MSGRFLRSSLGVGAALAAWLSAVPAEAQTQAAGLRGAEDAVPADTSPLTLPSPAVGLAPAPLTLRKPASIARIGATPPTPPALSQEEDAGPAPAQPPVPTGAPQAFGTPVLDGQGTATRPRRKAKDDDPFAPTGLTMGAFLLKPSLETDFGYSDNPGQQPGKTKGSTFVTVSPALEFTSDWARHELRGSIQGSYTDYFAVDDKQPRLNALIDGRLDVQRDTALNAELRLNLDTERIGSDGVSANATKRPLTVAYGTTLGVTQQFGDFSLRLSGSADRNTYEDSGSGNRDYNTFGSALRASYEVSPAVKPFVEISGDRRIHDETVSITGERRDSDGLTGRAGVALDFNGTLTGEGSVGYGRRRYDDPTLRALDGLLVDASLVWTPTALTTVTLKAASDLAESTMLGASGALTRSAGITVAHSLRRNLTATAGASINVAQYQGISLTEKTYDATFGLEYKLSRSVSVKASYAYERLASTNAGADYTSNTIFVGLRLQR